MGPAHKVKDTGGTQTLLLTWSLAFCQPGLLGPLGRAAENVPQRAQCAGVQIFKRHLGGFICFLIRNPKWGH